MDAKERDRLKQARYRAAHPQQILDYQKRIRAERLAKGLCGGCGKRPPTTKTLCEECHQKGQERYYGYKQAVFDHYGAVCACCGEDEPAFLSIDHIDNDGAEHRRTHGYRNNLYVWLRRNGFPEGFRTVGPKSGEIYGNL